LDVARELGLRPVPLEPDRVPEHEHLGAPRGADEEAFVRPLPGLLEALLVDEARSRLQGVAELCRGGREEAKENDADHSSPHASRPHRENDSRPLRLREMAECAA
jgi:hypothetical protein